jgi:NitT/TauT family transport system ATP-binding protein
MQEGFGIMGCIISIENLSKIYSQSGSSSANGQVKVLEDICLNVNSGEFVSIFGPNGCGKTTLLLCLAGVIEPSEGQVTINNKSPKEAVIGFVFQNYREALLPWRSCVDNIAFPLEVAGEKKQIRRGKAGELVKKLGLKIDLDSHPYQQSGGQQQLVAIARALISEPNVLVMDEPLSSLDIRANILMRSQIEEIWQKTNIPTLYVSHDIDDSVYLSDRIVLLSERPGRILKIIDNPLPRPRSQVVKTKEFNELRNQVLSFYSEEK